LTLTRAVFFDWYDTLARYEPSTEQVQLIACQSVGLSPDAKALWRSIPVADRYFYGENQRLRVEGRPDEEKFEVYFRYESLVLEGAGINVPSDLVRQIQLKARELSTGRRFVLFDDTISALKSLKGKGLMLGMISNIPPDKLLVCAELGLLEHLDFTVIPSEVGVEKPDPAIFLKALSKAGVRASEAMHVGDQYNIDIVGAKKAGIKPVMIDRHNLFPEVTDCHRIRSLDEIAGIISVN
jgi:putative hydrolase of the HAD superfamily